MMVADIRQRKSSRLSSSGLIETLDGVPLTFFMGLPLKRLQIEVGILFVIIRHRLFPSFLARNSR